MTYTETKVQTSPLSYADRCVIASVLTWDNMGNPFSPDDIWAIRIEEDMVWVRLTGDRSYPISRFMFRSILETQRNAATQQLETIIETEAAEVLEAEREMSEIIHEVAQEELDEYLANQNDWLIEPIGTNPDYIFGLCGKRKRQSCHQSRTTTTVQHGRLASANSKQSGHLLSHN